MDVKDIAIGILLIGLVTTAGWVGFLYVNPVTETKTEKEEKTVFIVQETPPIYDSGLPDDWSTAPNASIITLYNETGDAIDITLKEILDFVKKYEETSQHQEWYEKRLETITFEDPSGIPITGVDLLDVLRVFDCNFAGELELRSYNDTASKVTLDVARLCDVYGRDRNTIIALAANKQWLPNSILGDRCGNFSIFNRDTTIGDGEVEVTCYDLESITVTKNWTITVKVFNNDGSLNQTLELDYLNMTTNPTEPQTYEYSNTEYFNFNRTYYGRNVSTIVDYTNAKGMNYIVNFTFSDGAFQPLTNNKRKITSLVPYFNWTDVEIHLADNGTNIVGNHVDLVNGSIPMLKTDLKMCIVHNLKMRTEYYPGATEIANFPWDDFYNEGYPPYKLIIPGAARSRFYNGLSEITITILGPRT